MWDMDIYPDVDMSEPGAPETVADRGRGLRVLRRLLDAQPETAQNRRLRASLDELLVETPDGVTVRGAAQVRQSFLSWNV